MASTKKTVFGILERPRITEKGALASSVNNSVVFMVHPRANKVEIKTAVEKIFDVEVKSVRTMNYMGKVKRVGAKIGRQVAWKKAYVSLAPGSSINLIEGL
ncbi:MAG: 50S ribosomal protein L23 [Bdellovibrionota bacterium]